MSRNQVCDVQVFPFKGKVYLIFFLRAPSLKIEAGYSAELTLSTVNSLVMAEEQEGESLVSNITETP